MGDEHEPLVVTISAPYGAGGSVIGPRLAAALDLPFLDRAIPAEVAERLDMPLSEALEHDEAPPAALDRLLRPFAAFGYAMAGTEPIAPPPDSPTAETTEAIIRECARHAGGVILGRAGAVVLRDRPSTLHVRLTGSVERRITQAMVIEGVDRGTAARRRNQVDRAREGYLRWFYGVDAADPVLYHLILDSTAIALDACVELIACAARALAATGGATPAGTTPARGG